MAIPNTRPRSRGVCANRYFLYVTKYCSCFADKWMTKFAISAIFIVSLSALFLVFQPFSTEINVLLINTDDPPKYITRTEFLSVALDSSIIAEDFLGFNMSDQFLQNLIIPLGGSFLRIGGTMADCLTFILNKNTSHKSLQTAQDGGVCTFEKDLCLPLKRSNFTMSGDEWLQINALAKKTGLKIIFDLNCLKRNKNGSWDSTNAKELIKFSAENNLELHWELGNEPNSFRHVFNKTINATQLGKDFIELNSILSKYQIYKQSLVVGPDITKPNPYNVKIKEYLMDFLNSSKGAINALTWHQYYFNERDASIFHYLNPDIFNLLEMEINTVKEILLNSGYKNMPMWLGETSDAYGGGSKDFSDKFISTFIWLDKLGLSAKKGVEVVVRQSLFKGNYALINKNYFPTPNWWISVLFKKLVGSQVVECYTAAPPEVRLYCHCSLVNDVSKIPSITVFGVNMKNSDANIRIQEFKTDKLKVYSIEAFILVTRISILSENIYLNKHRLSVDEFGNLPSIKGINITSGVLNIPAFSLGFWNIQSYDFRVCNM